MSLTGTIRQAGAAAIRNLYGMDIQESEVLVNQTSPDFQGDYTIVLFALVKKLRRSPEQLGNEIGELLVSQNRNLFFGYNVIKGFLNLSVHDDYFISFLSREHAAPSIQSSSAPLSMIVEYSSPNTNKPLHLGHLRNNFLGWSVAEILRSLGHRIFKTCIVNDRGIHICKSMIAWQIFGNGETPGSTGIKGDHFVGDYYVKCENEIRRQAAGLSTAADAGDLEGILEEERQKFIELGELRDAISGNEEKDREKRKKLDADRMEIIRSSTPVMRQARQMLVAWENGDPEVVGLWKKMNSWVYSGFEQTYERIGTDFDRIYYESETYLLGRNFVEKGLQRGIFYRKDDGSVWVDLSEEGLDEKLLLRRDGTSVYITQDLGLAEEKYRDFPYDESLYVIADEQNYHMKVLQLILKKLEMPYAGGIHHLSYGMVELPSGRMKSREGTVVDADDMVDEMVRIAEKHTRELGKVQDFNEEELGELYEIIGLGALKFYLLRVDPRKKMVFNPEESIDFHGFTGPFIQYTHARIRSILRKADEAGITMATISSGSLLKLEKNMLILLEQLPAVLSEAAGGFNPSVIANYAYQVAKMYNAFYTEHSVLNAENEEKKHLRLQICALTAFVIKHCMGLLGIRVPERM